MSKDDLKKLIPAYSTPANFPKIDCFEKLLIANILERSFLDLRLPDKKGDITRNNAQMIRQEAERWINYDGDEEWTYRWCCNQVALDYADVRSKLRAQGLIVNPVWLFSEDDKFFRARESASPNRRKSKPSNVRRFAKVRRLKLALKRSRSQ
jgi:hypothetical protein